MIGYELWTHRFTHAFYAVRLNEGRVTGVCGPLPFSTLSARGDLAGYIYDDRPEAIEEALRHPEQLGLAEAWRRGRAEGVQLPRWSRTLDAVDALPTGR
jgi:hypothetical protein